MKLFEVVSWEDPALDMTAEERVVYRETRDITKIREIPGMKAMRFFIRMIPMSLMRFIDEARSERERSYRAFMAGVERIENARLGDGSTESCARGTLTSEVAGVGRIVVWSDADLERLHLGRIEREIGGVAYAHSDFHSDAVRIYPPPPGLELAWATVERLHAEKILRDAAKSSGVPKAVEESAPRKESDSERHGDAPTDATVTG